jgi:hypothetical protein
MLTEEEGEKALFFVTVWGILVAYKSRIFTVSGFFVLLH